MAFAPEPPTATKIDFQKLFEAPETEIVEIVRISLRNLLETMARHPGIYGYAAAAFEAGKVRQLELEYGVKQAKARAFSHFLQQTSATAADKLVDGDQGVIEAQATLIRQMREVAALGALVRALDHRRDMLVQIAARQRQEATNS
jgi:hypothetical protein